MILDHLRGHVSVAILCLAGCGRGRCPVHEVWPYPGSYELVVGGPCTDTGEACRDEWTLKVDGPLVQLTYVDEQGALRRLTFRSETAIPFGDTPWW